MVAMVVAPTPPHRHDLWSDLDRPEGQNSDNEDDVQNKRKAIRYPLSRTLRLMPSIPVIHKLSSFSSSSRRLITFAGTPPNTQYPSGKLFVTTAFAPTTV